ncbi:MAG: phospho-N-acetylmuramoyl-pentapeptide-transferase [Oscillibacter sp.]|nr:phospho-N-acetylmuramoyl-pentapeptide-transferase [Oscillibacter sp.]
MEILGAAVLAFALTALLGVFVLRELRKLKAGQEIRQDGPTWHNSKAGTPTMGGIMFILGIGVAVLATGWREFLTGRYTHLYVFLFAFCFGLIGFVDDYRKVRQHQNEGLTAKQKFIIQLLTAVVFLSLMRFEGLLSNRLYFPFFNAFWTIPWVFYLVFAAFVIVGCVNAVNITDGVDGLAASVTAVVAVFFTVAALIRKMTDLGIFAAALFGGLAAFFLFYNRYHAKCFMGDTGSLFLGGAVTAMAFAIDMPLILLFVGIVYVLETLSDLIQVGYFKATHGKRFFKMAPLHHHLEKCGWSENRIVAVFSAVTLAFCLLSLLAVRA